MTSIGLGGVGVLDGPPKRADAAAGVPCASDLGKRANVRFRRARGSDAPDLACLIDCASRGLALWLWSTLRAAGQSSIEVGRHRIRTVTASPLHYGAFTVAEFGGAFAGR